MLLGHFGVVLYNVTQVSFRQRLCPRPLLGRMNASIRFLVWGVMPIGACSAASSATTSGSGRSSGSRPSASILAALPVLISPLIGMRDLPRELDQLS